MIETETTFRLFCDGAHCPRESNAMPSEDEALHAAVVAGWYVSSRIHLCPLCYWHSKAAVTRATPTEPKDSTDA